MTTAEENGITTVAIYGEDVDFNSIIEPLINE